MTGRFCFFVPRLYWEKERDRWDTCKIGSMEVQLFSWEDFALRGEFLFHVEKEPKDAGERLRMSAPRSYSPFPQPPITGDAHLGIC